MTEKAIHHFEVAALGTASLRLDQQACFGFITTWKTCSGTKAGSVTRAVNSTYNPGHAMKLQARVWYKQHKLEEARSEARRTTEVFEELGAAKDLEGCRKLLRDMQNGLNDSVTSGQSGFNCGFMQMALFPARTDIPFYYKPKLQRVLEIHPPTNFPPHPAPPIFLPSFTFTHLVLHLLFHHSSSAICPVLYAPVCLAVFHTQRQTLRPFECRRKC